MEASTRAAYVSNLNKHFYPFFGQRRLNRISPSLVQDWVTQAHGDGLSPRSIRKYHVFLSSIFARAVKDRVLVYNPCDHTELPKVITRKTRTLTPEEFDRLLTALPAQHRLMIETLIEAGLRWGELVALKPRHIDFLRRSLAVEETIVEVSNKHSPTGQRYLSKPYPKDNVRNCREVPMPEVQQLARFVVERQFSQISASAVAREIPRFVPMLTQIDPERTEAHGTEPECLEPEETRLPEGASADDPPFVNLCGLDYYERRSRLFNALQTLEKGQELELASDEPDDVQWLRYEVEARLTRRFRWSLPVKVTGKARTTVACP